jgi:hypothetical protein
LQGPRRMAKVRASSRDTSVRNDCDNRPRFGCVLTAADVYSLTPRTAPGGRAFARGGPGSMKQTAMARGGCIPKLGHPAQKALLAPKDATYRCRM